MKICDMIKGKKHFKIGYFGGSITEGAGEATDKEIWIDGVHPTDFGYNIL